MLIAILTTQSNFSGASLRTVAVTLYAISLPMLGILNLYFQFFSFPSLMSDYCIYCLVHVR